MKDDKELAAHIASKAFQNTITKEEQEQARRKLEENRPEDRAHMQLWIQALGLSGAKEERKLLEKFLYYPANPLAAVEALKFLVLWGFEKEYRSELTSFLRGVAWDSDDHVMQREVAWPAGLYLRYHRDKEMLQILLDLVEDPARVKGEKDMHKIRALWPKLRFAAYLALADAMGTSHSDIEEFATFAFDEDFNPSTPDPLNVLGYAKEELELADDTINTYKYLKRVQAKDLSASEFQALKESFLKNGFQKLSRPLFFVALLQRLDEALIEELIPLLEQYLESSHDPEVSKQILTLFVRYLNRGAKYVAKMKECIEGIAWDDGSMREQAIGLAGEYLRDHHDDALFHLLIQMYENPGAFEKENGSISSRQWTWLQAVAYGAIHEAMGIAPDEIDFFEVEKLLRSGQFEQLHTPLLSQAYERVGKEAMLPQVKKSTEYAEILEDLVAKADSGHLSDEELFFAEEKLKSNELDDLVHMDQWIHIVGKTHSFGARTEIEKFLNRSEHSDVSILASQEALRVLCLEWGLAKDYLQHIKHCIVGDSDSQTLAIEIAGVFLRENEDNELLTTLLAIQENPSEYDLSKSRSFGGYFSWNYLEYVAYLALSSAMDKESLPFRDYMSRSRNDPSIMSIIELAKERVHCS